MFEIKEDFYLDGKPFRIISGSIHYFRVPSFYWHDRLVKLRNMGCNTVETYIPWNFHETKKGCFDFEGDHDVVAFIKEATKVGLYVIIRPSPYICAEYEFGGLPAWLLKDPAMRLRCNYKPYMDAVRDYYSVLLPKLVPYQNDHGGNIILMQIENEYGYYGDDTSYMTALKDLMRKNGITIPLVTSDGPMHDSFEAGMCPEALRTGNFGSHVKEQFKVMTDKGLKNKPLMCMEFWVGWFDAWGEAHHTSDLEQNKKDFEDALTLGNVNIYMAEGGTNFGYTAGINAGARNPDVTSYDYDGVLTEDGQITPKYLAFKEIISRHAKISELPLEEIKRRNYGELKCTGKAGLFENLDNLTKPIHTLYPETMENLDSYYGYVLYRAALKKNEKASVIQTEGAHDRVWAYQNSRLLFKQSNEQLDKPFTVAESEEGAVIDILVENCSRVNFGATMEDQRKGLTKGLRINEYRHFGFDTYCLPLDKGQVERIDFAAGIKTGEPAFYRFEFDADECCDTFLDFTGFGKGVAIINGINLGRYWEIGPQRRLYVPSPYIHKGKNTIILFETEGMSGETITLTDKPQIG